MSYFNFFVYISMRIKLHKQVWVYWLQNKVENYCDFNLPQTYPAAHISGEGFRWTPVQPGTNYPSTCI